MAIYVRGENIERDLVKQNIKIFNNKADFSLIEEECLIAIINFENLEWPLKFDDVRELIKLEENNIFTFAIINQKIYSKINDLSKLEHLALIREDQARILLTNRLLKTTEQLAQRLKECHHIEDRKRLRAIVASSITHHLEEQYIKIDDERVRVHTATFNEVNLNQINQEVCLLITKVEKLQCSVDRIENSVDRIDKKLDSINYSLFRIKINSSNILLYLPKMNLELEKLKDIIKYISIDYKNLDQMQADRISYMVQDLKERIIDTEQLILSTSKNQDINAQNILNTIAELKQTDSVVLLQRSADIIQVFTFLIQLFTVISGLPIK